MLAAALALAAVAPVTVLASGERQLGPVAGPGDRIAALAPPLETCAPGEVRIVLGLDVCGPETGGGPGFNIASLLPIVGLLVGGGLIALLAAFVVLRRTSAPPVPADPGEWWTCRNCGKTNVVGSARCYACGAWPR